MNGWPLLARSRWLVPGPAICVASRDWLDLLSPYKDQLGSASSWPFFFVLGELLPSVRAWCLGRFLSCYIVPVILVGRHRLFATFLPHAAIWWELSECTRHFTDMDSNRATTRANVVDSHIASS